MIGVWVMLGFCTVLLLSGIGKIDLALYEAARLDGAGRISEFFAVTLPGLRRELVVCTTFTMIAALASFDIIQISTQGGPGYQTMVPGVQIYRLTFLQQHIGQASALAVFLAALVLVLIWPIQRLGRERSTAHRITRTGILLALMLFAIVPLLSMFTTALAAPGSTPQGLTWPSDPHWHNFVDAWNAANFLALFRSSTLIVLGVVPATVAMATAAGYALAQLNVPFGKAIYGLLIVGLTLPFEALITPLYYDLRGMGLLGTRLAIVLPLIGLLMPFGVFWMRAHFLGAEPALTEAAKVDGATTWQIVPPRSSPTGHVRLVRVGVLFFLASWNQYLLPLVLVDDPTKRTVAGGLGAFQGQYGTDIALLCAGSLLIILPSLVIFLIFQRNFVKALMQGAIKVRRPPAAGPRACPAGPAQLSPRGQIGADLARAGPIPGNGSCKQRGRVPGQARRGLPGTRPLRACCRELAPGTGRVPRDWRSGSGGRHAQRSR